MTMRALDHLHSRKLKSIRVSKDGTWKIMLEGDAVIANHDSGLRQPDIPKNMLKELTLVTTILEEERTTLVLQTNDRNQEWRVILNPTMYSIKFPEDKEESFPQRGLVLIETPPHPDERVADGPTGEEEGEEE